MKCRDTHQVRLFYVKDRKKKTLLPIITKYVKQGSTIITDKFASYLNIKSNESYLDKEGFYHFWVNHSQEFVDKFQPFVHTNTIERTWRSLRNQISSIKRTFAPGHVQQYLDTFMLKALKTSEEMYELMIYIINILNNKPAVVKELAEVIQ